MKRIATLLASVFVIATVQCLDHDIDSFKKAQEEYQKQKAEKELSQTSAKWNPFKEAACDDLRGVVNFDRAEDTDWTAIFRFGDK